MTPIKAMIEFVKVQEEMEKIKIIRMERKLIAGVFKKNDVIIQDKITDIEEKIKGKVTG